MALLWLMHTLHLVRVAVHVSDAACSFCRYFTSLHYWLLWGWTLLIADRQSRSCKRRSIWPVQAGQDDHPTAGKCLDRANSTPPGPFSTIYPAVGLFAAVVHMQGPCMQKWHWLVFTMPCKLP